MRLPLLIFAWLLSRFLLLSKTIVSNYMSFTAIWTRNVQSLQHLHTSIPIVLNKMRTEVVQKWAKMGGGSAWPCLHQNNGQKHIGFLRHTKWLCDDVDMNVSINKYKCLKSPLRPSLEKGDAIIHTNQYKKLFQMRNALLIITTGNPIATYWLVPKLHPGP